MTGDEAEALARRRADAMYAADEASRRLGITAPDVEPGRAVMRLAITESMVNGHGIAHGGYIFLLADTAFAFASNTRGHTGVAARADITFVAPARAGDELEATAVERVRYGRNGLYDVTVRRGDGTVVAMFHGHSRTVRHRPKKENPG